MQHWCFLFLPPSFAHTRSDVTEDANRLLHLFQFLLLPFTYNILIWIYDNDFYFFFKCFFMIAVVCLYLPRSAMFILAQPSHDWTHWPLKHQFVFINMKRLAMPLSWDTGWDPAVSGSVHTLRHVSRTLCSDPALSPAQFQVVKVWFNLWTHLSLYEHSES